VNSFGEYLQLYNDRWNDLSQNDTGLLDYGDRTLYSTWNLSLTQIQNQDPAAVELLRLMAYLDNQDLWYELFRDGAKDQPLWWSEVAENRVRFDRAMAILHSYSLVEARPGSYSLHACVHDWTLGYLNRNFNDELCVLAIHCIAQSVKDDMEANYWVVNRRLLQHAQRLKHTRISRWISWSSVRPGDLSCVAYLYSQSDMNMEAEEMYVRALRGYEKAWGAEHTLTLETVNNLGVLYTDQGKMVEAEEMYIRALRGYDKARGAEHISTLNTVHNLGALYADQGKMVEAEEMYVRALRGKEKAWGAEHTLTLDTVNNLGLLYTKQGKMVEAEKMYMWALRGKEKAWGAEHTLTLNTVYNLGLLYAKQGKMVEAEEMYMRALRGYEKAWRAEHTSTLGTVYNLGMLYADQGKMVEAEKMYMRALRGYEKAWGAEHTSTLDTVYNLGMLYAKQGKMVEAEKMYMRALRGYEKAWGAEHTLTLDTVYNLGVLYAKQGRMVEAEEMYMRALRGYEKAWGAEHTSTLNTVYNLGLLYAKQGKMVEAEEMYMRALRDHEKVLGPEHRSTINTAYNLYVLVREQSWKLKFESDGAVENCFHTVEKVIKILKSSESLPINIWGLLGRNLIWLSDEPNAQIAFQQGIELQDGMLVYTNVLCDGCDLRLTCDMKRFVCQVCQDVDICKHCYDKHKNGKMAISSCTGHAFLEISPEIVSGPSGLHVVGQSERAIWLENLCKQYSPPF
jgi:tetratricopeptide (TPR) repeat protein